MSYRELRNFSEILRFLGYQRQVSIENFKTPNFQLVAEILQWFVKRFDPDHDISLQIETEQDRIIFIKTICLFLLQKARLKINPKKLYQADGYAVQELLKIAVLLYKSVQQSDSNVDEDEENIKLAELRNTVHTKLDQLRQSRQIASEITDKGALLYDLLSKEVDLKVTITVQLLENLFLEVLFLIKEQRSLALAKPLEMNDVRRNLKLAVKAVEDEVKQLNQNLDNITADEAALDAKIEKKKIELERQQKRLAQIQAVRPAYMDEYEKYEEELKRLYAIYVQKYRNLAFLQHMQANYDKIQMEKAAVSYV
uniref:Clusterin-associated protein 1 n=1 Tax=Romanomermis culicivorax TaxID=13658 RepID=A0A915IM93_ROMCU